MTDTSTETAKLNKGEKMRRATVACLGIAASGRKTLTPEFCASTMILLSALAAERDALKEALTGLSNWSDALRTLIDDTSCEPDDDAAFAETLLCFDLQLTQARAALAGEVEG